MGASAANASRTGAGASKAYAQALALEQARLRAAAGAQAKAGVPPEDAAPAAGANRERAANRAVNVAGIVVIVLVAAAAAWWFTSGRTPRFDDPDSPLRADETFPAQAVPVPGTQLRSARPSASASATGTPPAPLGNASDAALPSAASSGASAPPAPPGAVAVEGAAELDEVADELMSKRMPRVAEAAGRNLARVLNTAAGAREFRRRGTVRAAAESVRSASAPPELASRVREQDARTLNDAALVAYGRSDDASNAVRLQKRAFAANPLDSEVVGNLAFLHLKERPPQAEAARQLALHALTLNDPRFPSGRIEDWTTLAVASALAGRDADARNAWFASMALTSDLQRQCDAAIRAETIYGERLHPSVQAMLQRARSSAAYGRCEVADAPEATRPPEATRTQPRAKTSAAANHSRKVPDSTHRSHR